eukprot:366340-Chlamydomonas_euryale.AAC.7
MGGRRAYLSLPPLTSLVTSRLQVCRRGGQRGDECRRQAEQPARASDLGASGGAPSLTLLSPSKQAYVPHLGRVLTEPARSLGKRLEGHGNVPTLALSPRRSRRPRYAHPVSLAAHHATRALKHPRDQRAPRQRPS